METGKVARDFNVNRQAFLPSEGLAGMGGRHCSERWLGGSMLDTQKNIRFRHDSMLVTADLTGRRYAMAGIVYSAGADIGQVAQGYPIWRGSGWELNVLLSAVGICGIPEDDFLPSPQGQVIIRLCCFQLRHEQTAKSGGHDHIAFERWSEM
jgi:hypothetical protein